LFTDRDIIELDSSGLDVVVGWWVLYLSWLDTEPTNQPQHPIRSNQAQYCLYLYTNNVKMYEISTSKYLHIVLSIYFSVYNLTIPTEGRNM